MTFSPKLIFWVTFYAMIGSGVGVAGHSFDLTGMVPAAWIVPITAWIHAGTFCALSFLTLATGYAGVGRGPLAPPPTPLEARDIATAAGVAVRAEPLTKP